MDAQRRRVGDDTSYLVVALGGNALRTRFRLLFLFVLFECRSQQPVIAQAFHEIVGGDYQ